MAKTPIPRVPIQTPMFEQGPDGAPRLTRTWIIFFEKLQQRGIGAGGGPYVRTLLIKNTAVGTDVADHVPIWVAGTAVRVVGVLRNAITSDLTVRVNLDGSPLITLTIPHTTAVDTPVVKTATFTPTSFDDLAVLSWDITASDGSTDPKGVCSLTVEWQ